MSGGGLVETTFFNRTYDEALQLVVEARDYIADNLNIDRNDASFADRLTYDCETLRLSKSDFREKAALRWPWVSV